jgi:hypothetical protein
MPKCLDNTMDRPTIVTDFNVSPDSSPNAPRRESTNSKRKQTILNSIVREAINELGLGM